MQYSVFHTLHIGAAHVQRGLPCQDMCLSERDDRHAIAVVSDGHGNRRHFRSERGSQKACEIALDKIRDFLNRMDGSSPEEREAQIGHLKFDICRDWRFAILQDAANNPWTQEEIEEQQQILSDEQFALFQSGKSAALAYGCTLCAVFAAPWGWGAIQLGDGCLTVIDADGSYRWPMPESILNHGHRTASLCASNPLTDFRHVLEEGNPIGLMVYTDGIEKPFPNQGKEIIGLLHWIWKNQRFGDENRLETLTQLLGQLTQRSPLGDDVSIAGLIDPDAQDAAPKFNPDQHAQELQALQSQREELLTTIQYNRRRLNDILQSAPQSDAQQQICQILRRREADLEAVTRAIEAKRAQMGLPPLQEPEEEAPAPETEHISAPQPEPAPAETPEEQSQFQEDHYFWGNEEDAQPVPEEKEPSPRKTQPHRDPVPPQPQRRDPLPHQRKDPFEAFSDLSRIFDEALDEAANILNIFRKRR